MNLQKVAKGRVAVVSGAAQGIGAAYARALARVGFTAVVADIQLAAAEKTAAAVRAEGGEAIAMAVDVTDKRSTLELASEVREHCGGAHILVNNAGILPAAAPDPQLTVDLDEWRRIFAVNLEGVLLMTQAIAPMMIEAGWGRVINQSSRAAYRGTPGAYAVAKLAVIGLTRGFARELGIHGITVNSIAPGPVFTEALESSITESRRAELLAEQAIPMRATPEALISTLLYLCEDGSDWVTGQTLLIDGGSTARL